MRARRRTAALLATTVLALAGCGGDEPDTTADPTTDAAAADTATDGDPADPAGDDGAAPDDGAATGPTEDAADGGTTGGPVPATGTCPLPDCGDGLLPELAGVPVPPTADTYGIGQADRIDGLASQEVFLAGTLDEVVAFYADEVLASDVEVTFEYADEAEYALEWTTPEGRSIKVSVVTGREYHPLVLGILAPPA